MIIKSAHKDYYDFVAHTYGGDPKIVYSRQRLTQLQNIGGVHIAYPLKVKFKLNRSIRDLDPRYRTEDSLAYVCVAGKFYLTKEKATKSGIAREIITPQKDADLITSLTKRHWSSQPRTYEWYVGFEDHNLIELSKLINAPVFTLLGEEWDWSSKTKVLVIDSEIPILGDIGLPALYPPEQLYQDLAYFISNKMKDNPDIAPPVTLSDKDRIVQHGFDLKQSFRHRDYSPCLKARGSFCKRV